MNIILLLFLCFTTSAEINHINTHPSNENKNITINEENKTSSFDSKELPEVKVHLIQPTNFYIFALPLVTIVIVIGSAFLTIKTIKIKSKESIDALEISNSQQVIINDENNKAERLKAQESIISNSRQAWINNLRDQISSLLSHQTQFDFSNLDRKLEITSKTWDEIFQIELLLNPKEELHNKLLKEIQLGNSFYVDPEKKTEYVKQRMIVLQLSKQVLKEEWQRVKSFE